MPDGCMTPDSLAIRGSASLCGGAVSVHRRPRTPPPPPPANGRPALTKLIRWMGLLRCVGCLPGSFRGESDAAPPPPASPSYPTRLHRYSIQMPAPSTLPFYHAPRPIECSALVVRLSDVLAACPVSDPACTSHRDSCRTGSIPVGRGSSVSSEFARDGLSQVSRLAPHLS